MSEYTGSVKAKFVGKPNGILMKGAPGAPYVHGQVYTIPFKFSKFPYWEILDPPPVLRVPPARVEESVFENTIFVPPDFNNVENSVPSGPILNESFASPTVPPAEPVAEDGARLNMPISTLVDGTGTMRGEDDDMPPELIYELKQMGDGVIGEKGEVKVERRGRPKINKNV